MSDKPLTLKQALHAAAAWNRADLQGIEDITPDADMLKARRAVLREALKDLAETRNALELAAGWIDANREDESTGEGQQARWILDTLRAVITGV